MSTRVRRKTDYAWKHATEIVRDGNKYVRCNYCSHEMCNCSITKMKKHLAGVVGFGKVCTEVPQAVREGFKENFEEDPLLKVQRLKASCQQKKVPPPPPPAESLNPGGLGEASQHSAPMNRFELLASLELKLKETFEQIHALAGEVKMVQEEIAEIRKSLAEVAGKDGNARKMATIDSKLKGKYEHMQALTDRLEIVHKEFAEMRKSLSEVAGEAGNARKKSKTEVAGEAGQTKEEIQD